MVLRKHLERLAGYLERLCRDPRSVLRSGAEGLVAALLLPRLQSFATEFLCGASLADHAAPEDVEAKALGFFTELQLEIRMEEVRTLGADNWFRWRFGAHVGREEVRESLAGGSFKGLRAAAV